jgi:Putative motility protein
MDLTNDIASLATSMQQTKTQQEVGVTVLKKALDSQTQTAQAMIATLPQPPNLPPNLGQNINTTA